jgi:hypothetical protein
MGTDRIVLERRQLRTDEHLALLIEQEEGRPPINLDVGNSHGRAYLSVRVNGMMVASLLLDVEHLPPVGGNVLTRFCPFCGEENNFISSKGHVCKSDDG